MLVMARKTGESITLEAGGHRVEVKLLQSGNGRARIGVEAPGDVAIVRTELIGREGVIHNRTSNNEQQRATV